MLKVRLSHFTGSEEVVEVHFAAKDLDRKDVFGKSDPFMVISRTSPMQSKIEQFIIDVL